MVSSPARLHGSSRAVHTKAQRAAARVRVAAGGRWLDDLGDRLTEATVLLVLLRREDRAAVAGGALDRVAVHGRDRGHVQHPRLDPHGGEPVRGLERVHGLFGDVGRGYAQAVAPA